MFDQGIEEIKADYNHKANKSFVIFLYPYPNNML